MPQYRRAPVPGGTFFFTVNAYRRRAILTDVSTRRALREAIHQVRMILPFRINAWVLLPDHLHCIWTLPDGDANFSSRWAMIKRFVTQRHRELDDSFVLSASRLKRHESGLWQRRFWEHRIRDENDYRRHMDYVHWNPVKHGFVTRVAGWKYSSFHHYAAQGVYPWDWAGDIALVPGRDFGE